MQVGELERYGVWTFRVEGKGFQAEKTIKQICRFGKKKESAEGSFWVEDRELEGEEYVCRGRLEADRRGPITQQPQVPGNLSQGTHPKATHNQADLQIQHHCYQNPS